MRLSFRRYIEWLKDTWATTPVPVIYTWVLTVRLAVGLLTTLTIRSSFDVRLSLLIDSLS